MGLGRRRQLHDEMRDALDSADRVVALLSPAYFEPRRYTTNEWSTAMLHDADGNHRLLPVLIEKFDPPSLFGPVIAPMLAGLTAGDAPPGTAERGARTAAADRHATVSRCPRQRAGAFVR